MPTISDIVVKMSVDTAQMRSELEKLRSDFDKFASGAKRALGDLGNSAKRMFEVFSGIQLSNFADQMARAAVEAVKMARAADLAEYAFDQLAQQANVSGRTLVRSLEEASGRTIDVSNVLESAARGLQQNLAPEQLVRLMEIARSQSVLTGQTVEDAFNTLTRAVANFQPRALKAMGIIVDQDAALRRFADTLGLDATLLNEYGRTQALVVAISEQMRDKQIDVTASIVRHKEALEQLGAMGRNVWQNLGKDMNDALNSMLDASQRFFATPFMTWLREQVTLGGTRGQTSGVGQWLRGVFGVEAKGAGVFPGELGGVMGGGAGPAAAKSLVDEDRLKRLRMTIAAQDQLQRALSGTAVTEAALTEAIRATVNVETVEADILRVRLRLLDEETAALLANNTSQRGIAQTIEDRARVDRDRIQIESNAAVKRITLLGQLRVAMNAWTTEQLVADAALKDALITEARELELTKARVDAWTTLVALLRAGADTTAEEAAGFGMLAAEPPGGTAAFLERGRVLADFQKTMRDISASSKVLGLDFSSVTAEISATTDALIKLAQQGQTTDAEFQQLSSRLAYLQTVHEGVSVAFESLGRALSGTVTGILQGTLTVGQAFENMGRNIAASLVENVINRGLKLVQQALEDFLADENTRKLIQAGIGAVIGLFGAGAGASAGGGAGLNLSSYGPAMQHGGIVTGPTRALIGESGPEAVIPLSHGALVQVNIINQHPNAEVSQRTSGAGTGHEIHDLVIKELSRAAGNGELEGILRPYAMRRVPTSR